MKQVVDKINEAELVLVGLGEEVDVLNKVQHDLKQQKNIESIKNLWMIPFIEKIEIEKRMEEKKEFYRLLANCLAGKNYFIVSVGQDGGIRNAGLNENRIVEPCGGYQKMQCSERCSTELYDVPKDILQLIENYLKDLKAGKEVIQGNSGILEMVKEPVCPHCGKPLVFNNVSALHYVEEGYLTQWSVYKKWLQGTVNKKVCLLELGVGMKYPTVIRWPFEKIAFYNQKAELYRVHSRLYQITEELRGKGHGICQKPEEFMKELSNAF